MEKILKRHKLKRFRHCIFGSFAKALLALALATSVSAQALGVPGVPFTQILKKSEEGETKSEGLFLESTPTYVKFTGNDRLFLDIALPKSLDFDYTVMFWFRSLVGYDELMA